MLSKFRSGINLSHWLSQCDIGDINHLLNAIKPDDFRRIADAGADHVRLPVDYKLIESEKSGLLSDGLKYIDLAFKYSIDSGLAMLLDLHSAPGMNFATPEKNNIWNRDDLQMRFSQIWLGISEHFGKSYTDSLAFELLNEPTAKDNNDWNRIASIGLDAVRTVSSERLVFVGSNSWQSPWTFPDLKVFNDPNIVYSFHFYEPFIFTHQKANWVGYLKILNMDIEYPSVVKNLQKEAEEMPDASMKEQTLIYSEQTLDIQRLYQTLSPVIKFKDQNKVKVYCSEFGVIDMASNISRMNWFSDTISLFSKYGIGWAVWDYMGRFGIFKKDGTPKQEIKLIFG